MSEIRMNSPYEGAARFARFLSIASQDATVRKTVHKTVDSIKKTSKKVDGVNRFAVSVLIISGAVLYLSATGAGMTLVQALKDNFAK